MVARGGRRMIEIDGRHMDPLDIIAMVEWLEDRKLTKEERIFFGAEEE